FDAVYDQIHRDLLQLQAISDDLRKIGCQFRPDRYVVSHGLVAQERGGFSNDLIYIKSLLFRGAFLELRADPGNNVSSTFCISCDSGDRCAQQIEIGLIAPETP